MSWRRGNDAGAGVTVEEPNVNEQLPLAPEQAQPERPLPLWRKLAVGAILAVLLGGLGIALFLNANDETVEPPPAEPPAATPAVDGTPPPPELRNTGEDFNAIVRSVVDFTNWVYQYNPDPKWVSHIQHPRCECFKQTESNLTSLTTAGYRHDSPELKVHKVLLRDRTSADQVTLYVIIESPPGGIVDREGKVVQQREALPPTGFLEEWVRGSDGRWRTWQSTVLGPPGPGWETW